MSNLSIGFLNSSINAATTTITLKSGGINSFPVEPFFVTIAPKDELPTFDNSEIVLVKARTGSDSYTIARAQKDTSAKPFPAGALFFIGHYYEQSLRVGDIFMTMNSSPGTGRLFMDGSTYRIEEFPLLAEHIRRNSAYGTIVNANAFTLSDMRGRAPFMYDGILGSLGSKGGTKTQALTPNNYRQNAWQSEYLGGGLQQGFGNLGAGKGSGMNTFAGGATNATGNNVPFEIMPPFVVINFEVVAG
nr:MAG TPA: tail fiber protein [Caudoviricetes sp.]